MHQLYLKIYAMLSALSIETEKEMRKKKRKKKRKVKYIGAESFIMFRAYCQSSAENS